MGVFYKEVSPDITKNRDPWLLVWGPGSCSSPLPPLRKTCSMVYRSFMYISSEISQTLFRALKFTGSHGARCQVTNSLQMCPLSRELAARTSFISQGREFTLNWWTLQLLLILWSEKKVSFIKGKWISQNSNTVSQQWLQPKSDGKCILFAESFLRHPYINI